MVGKRVLKSVRRWFSSAAIAAVLLTSACATPAQFETGDVVEYRLTDTPERPRGVSGLNAIFVRYRGIETRTGKAITFYEGYHWPTQRIFKEGQICTATVSIEEFEFEGFFGRPERKIPSGPQVYISKQDCR